MKASTIKFVMLPVDESYKHFRLRCFCKRVCGIQNCALLEQLQNLLEQLQNSLLQL